MGQGGKGACLGTWDTRTWGCKIGDEGTQGHNIWDVGMLTNHKMFGVQCRGFNE